MSAMVFIGAHFGHWYVSLLYLGPVAVLVLAFVVQSWRERRRMRREDEERDGGGPR